MGDSDGRRYRRWRVIEIGDRTGRVVRIGSSTAFTWHCGWRAYTVLGDVSEQTLLGVARSISCL